MTGSPTLPDRWTDILRTRRVLDVAAQLGIARVARSFACPACGASHRGSDDRRGAVGFVSNGLGWRCHRCEAGGSAVDLAGYVLLGSVPPRGDAAGWRDLRARLTSHGLVTARDDDAPVRIAPSAPASRLRPPASELEAVWAACVRADEDPDVSAWLRSRGLDAGAVARLDLARALPPGFAGPPWLPSRTAAKYRAVLPAWDARGTLCTLRFRAVFDVDGAPKTRPPSGPADPRTGGNAYAVGGAVLACPIGLAILRGELIGLDEWDRTRIVIVEGETDFLTMVLHLVRVAGGLEERPAVFGIWSGSWTPEIADRIPPGCRVAALTDDDKTGREYAAKIAASLAGRCTVLERQ
jgi:hypothetical protein